MTIAERHSMILKRLEMKGYVRVKELAKELGVSLVTIRKDLKTLEDRKMLFRSHGSASFRPSQTVERPVNEKELLWADEKEAIASKAVELVESGESMIIGSGTTTLAFARALPGDGSYTVLTAAMNVSFALLDHNAIELIQLGGQVRKGANTAVGPYAEEMLSNFACQTLFLGVDGISPDFGLTTSNMMEAHLNRRMIESVQRTIVLCDSSKFGLRGFGKICEVNDVDVLITDERAPKDMIQEIEDQGVQVIFP
ncbi:MAG: DeoR/GlpR family DNA-binding transcription regulator [Bacteroidia bacterium]|nr:DeoR/GlpR family DNA-binding transcription regulator [Bacteroidia bacterium]